MPDRLARSYAYQILVTDELARHGVQVGYLDAPPLEDDPEATLLVQVQGVIAEYERAKIAERNRRGRLFRARAGEIVYRLVPYGYRRIARSPGAPCHLEIFEPEAMVVRRIFDDFIGGGYSLRRICWRLREAGILSPTGKPGPSPVSARCSATRPSIVERSTTAMSPYPPRRAERARAIGFGPPKEWIEIPVPAIVGEEVFEAAQRVSCDHTYFTPPRSRLISGCSDAW
jgi:site-specific DNA recombinase